MAVVMWSSGLLLCKKRTTSKRPWRAACTIASAVKGAPGRTTCGDKWRGYRSSNQRAFWFNPRSTAQYRASGYILRGGAHPKVEGINQTFEAYVKLNVQHKLISRHLVECTFAVPQTREMVRFEVEVCKLPRLKNLHGLKIKRLGGPSNDYKIICEWLLSHLTL
ncbi:hypothetical protein RI367_005932 [Sorochytrium milnesiophthora]